MSAVVTQADESAADLLFNRETSPTLHARAKGVLASHRSEAVEELVEVLGRLLSLVDRMDVASWLVTEHPAEWANAGDLVSDARTLISKHRGEQG